jgi:hypothetical protein
MVGIQLKRRLILGSGRLRCQPDCKPWLRRVCQSGGSRRQVCLDKTSRRRRLRHDYAMYGLCASGSGPTSQMATGLDTMWAGSGPLVHGEVASALQDDQEIRLTMLVQCAAGCRWVRGRVRNGCEACPSRCRSWSRCCRYQWARRLMNDLVALVSTRCRLGCAAVGPRSASWS